MQGFATMCKFIKYPRDNPNDDQANNEMTGKMKKTQAYPAPIFKPLIQKS